MPLKKQAWICVEMELPMRYSSWKHCQACHMPGDAPRPTVWGADLVAARRVSLNSRHDYFHVHKSFPQKYAAADHSTWIPCWPLQQENVQLIVFQCTWGSQAIAVRVSPSHKTSDQLATILLMGWLWVSVRQFGIFTREFSDLEIF